jgi:hypothetical protein
MALSISAPVQRSALKKGGISAALIEQLACACLSSGHMEEESARRTTFT